MTIDDIKALIANDESRTLELKKTTGELKDGMHSACAFLNTDGGWLIFGVAPTGLKIIGQQVTEATKREIGHAIAGLEPAVNVETHYVDVPDYPGNKVIAMHFDGWVWGGRPHTFHGCPYYKVESTTKVMPHEMYDERIRAYQPKSYSWETLPADGVSFADLNQKHIQGCIRLGVEGGRIPASALTAPIEETLTKWKLLKNGIPTNGAAMLFSDNVEEYSNFKLRMARFAGTDKNEFIDEKRAEGNFFDLLDAGLAFCFKHLNLSGKITNHSLQREERLEIPYKALREAIINSLCHRQWEKHNLTNSIAIYDDRVEIANPGIFPSRITPDNIKEPHESYPYNVAVAETLYRSMWLENWGSGVRRIIEACQEQGVEEPIWRWDGGFVYVVFQRAKTEAGKLPTDNKVNNSDKENDIQLTDYDKELRQRNLSEIQLNILELINQQPSITLKELAVRLAISISALRNQRSQMEKKGVFLCRKGATKKGIWEINLEQHMNPKQQIDKAVAALKILTAQSAKSPKEAQSNWDRLDSIGYYLKSNISALGGNYSKAALEALISKLYDEKSKG